MNVQQEQNGTITFANEVLATIAGLAACDIEGVAGMVGSLMEPAERTFSSYTGDEKQELLRSILCLEQFLEDIRTGLANT